MYFSAFSPKQVNCFLNSSAIFYDKIIIIVRSIMKNSRNFSKYSSTSIFPCLMTMLSNFTIFFIFQIFIFKCFFYKYNRFVHFHMVPAALLLIISFFFFKLIIFISCSLKYSLNFFIQSLPLYAQAYFLCF